MKDERLLTSTTIVHLALAQQNILAWPEIIPFMTSQFPGASQLRLLSGDDLLTVFVDFYEYMHL